MKKDTINPKHTREKERNEELPGYPEYSEDDDIYFKGKEEKDIDPEDVLEKKTRGIKGKQPPDLDDYESGSDLDVPGSELDDDLEMIGSEDEENNYYSLSDENIDDEEDLLE